MDQTYPNIKSEEGTKIVKMLLEFGADVNLQSKDSKKSALHHVCSKELFTIVDMLLAAGANILLKDKAGKTPFNYAKHVDIHDRLLAKGADITTLSTDEAALITLRKENRARNRANYIPASSQQQVVRISPAEADFFETNDDFTAALDSLKAKRDSYIAKSKSDGEQQIYAVVNSQHQLMSAELTAQLLELQRIQPQLLELSNSINTTALQSLATASPQSIAYLRTLGDNGVVAEQQYAYIRSDPLLHEYYIAFSQAVSSAVLACQTIYSGMVDNDSRSKGEKIMGYIDIAANASGFPGLSIVSAVCGHLVKLPNDIERAHTVKGIVTAFPTIDSHKFIEILSRELTVLLQVEIRSVATSQSYVRRTMWEKAKRTVEWLQTYENATPVQAYAATHASQLVDKLMKTTAPTITVQLTDIQQLIQWTLKTDKLGGKSITILLTQIRSGEFLNNNSTTSSKQSSTQTPSAGKKTKQTQKSLKNAPKSTSVPELSPQQIESTPVIKTQHAPPPDSTAILLAKLAAMEERERIREEREQERDAELIRLRELHAAREAEAELHKREINALKKDVHKLSPKSKESVVGQGGLAQAMEPQPSTAQFNKQSGEMHDKVHRIEQQAAHNAAAIEVLLQRARLEDESK